MCEAPGAGVGGVPGRCGAAAGGGGVGVGCPGAAAGGVTGFAGAAAGGSGRAGVGAGAGFAA
ncbi:hypothetical protein, partial [Bradyrhizobium tropiciagri]|uniref:hypothetical protein n=1 Tax=Bradyrhizobium tropiciagri TaxID=312253 RepID=UPI001876222A